MSKNPLAEKGEGTVWHKGPVISHRFTPKLLVSTRVATNGHSGLDSGTKKKRN